MEWFGKAPIYAVFVSSYESRETADADAAHSVSLFGQPGHVFMITGDTQRRFRVLLGEFATRDEADAWRTSMLAKGIHMGNVYRVEGVR